MLLAVRIGVVAEPIRAYALVAPGLCVVQDEQARAIWLRALAHFEAGAWDAARPDFLRVLGRCPDDGAARHLAALCAWAEGERPLAIRWLVQVHRQGHAPPATAVALAALHAESGVEPVAIGWLRRGLGAVETAEKAWWITRPAFDALWRNPAPSWLALIEELGLSPELSVTRALAVQPTVEAPEVPAPPPEGLTLRLSPLNPKLDSLDHAGNLRKQVEQRLVERIRPPAALTVENEVFEDELVTVDQALEVVPEEP